MVSPADGGLFEPQKPVSRTEVVDTFCKVLEKAGFEIRIQVREGICRFETLTGLQHGIC